MANLAPTSTGTHVKRLFAPTHSASDWRHLLADPEKQWRPGKSAYELAEAWEGASQTARGIPASIAGILDSVPVLRGAKLVIGLPELQVDLPGGGHASQTDLWALLDTGERLVSMAVEAKAGEPLGDTVGSWLAAGKPGNHRRVRLAALCQRLGIPDKGLEAIRYQLLHRAASALIMAEQFRASLAVLLIVSFNKNRDQKSLEAFRHFGCLFRATTDAGAITELPGERGIPLYAGWISAPPAPVSSIEAAV
jgi:hypothetical protein